MTKREARPGARWAAAIGLSAAIAIGAPAAAADIAEERADLARDQVEFGIEMAQHGLWREAAYRFERAVSLDPGYAAAFNNLAVALEQLGRFEEARAAYARARELDPEDLMIEGNEARFRELDDRRERPLRASGTP